MHNSKDDFLKDDQIPDPEEFRELHPIDDDSDTLEPYDHASEHREINPDDPDDLSKWAQEFQISESDLKAAIYLNGNSVRMIKKYLSV